MFVLGRSNEPSLKGFSETCTGSRLRSLKYLAPSRQRQSHHEEGQWYIRILRVSHDEDRILRDIPRAIQGHRP